MSIDRSSHYRIGNFCARNHVRREDGGLQKRTVKETKPVLIVYVRCRQSRPPFTHPTRQTTTDAKLGPCQKTITHSSPIPDFSHVSYRLVAILSVMRILLLMYRGECARFTWRISIKKMSSQMRSHLSWLIYRSRSPTIIVCICKPLARQTL